jgi:hypothetical protein
MKPEVVLVLEDAASPAFLVEAGGALAPGHVLARLRGRSG